MANDGADPVEAPLTDAARGLDSPRLGWPQKPFETLETIRGPRLGTVIACTSDTLISLAVEASHLPRGPKELPPEQRYALYERRDLDRILVLGGYAETLNDSTPCLFALLWIVDDALTLYTHLAFPRLFIKLAEMAVRIGEKIEQRTRKPYRRFATTRDNPPLDAALLTIPPMDRLADWRRFVDLRSGRSRSGVGKPADDARFAVKDRDDWARKLDQLGEELRDFAANVQIDAASVGSRTPVITRAIATMRGLTFGHVQKNARAQFAPDWIDKPIGNTVAMIFYNSVYSVILDRRGEPMRIPGLAPYSLLIPGPGENLLRRLQQPGLYVSLGPLASYQFAVVGPRKVQTLIYGGIFGLQRNVFGFTREELGTEVSKHSLQVKLSDYLDANHRNYALVSIVTPDAFASGDLSFGGLKRTVYKLIPLITEFALRDIKKRLETLPDRYKELIAEIAETAIREIVKDTIRNWAIEWLIKKIGKKVIPGVNLVSAISDAITGGDSERFRNVAACLIMAIRSGKPDDMTITSKILSKIAVDEVADRVVQKIIAETGKQVSKQIARVRGDGGADPVAELTQQPAPPEALPVEARPPDPNPPRPKLAEPATNDAPSDTGVRPQAPRRLSPPVAAENPDTLRRVADRGLGTPEKADSDARGVHQRTDTPTPKAKVARPDGQPPAQPEAAKPSKATPPRRRPAAEVAEAKRRRDAVVKAGQDADARAEAETAAERAEDARARGETAADTDLREVHDAMTERTGRGAKREAIEDRDIADQGLNPTAPPKKAESEAKVSGLIGEGREQVAGKVKVEVQDYRKAISKETQRDMRDDIIARRASGERDALARHFGRIGLPPEGLKEVEIPAPHGKGRTRRYDRAYPEGDTTVLVEAKNHRKSNLRLTKSIRQQLNNDIAILKSDDHVRIEVFLEGRVSTRALEAMKSMEKRFPGRYTIRYGETFDERTRTRKRAKPGRKIKKDR